MTVRSAGSFACLSDKKKGGYITYDVEEFEVIECQLAIL